MIPSCISCPVVASAVSRRLALLQHGQLLEVGQTRLQSLCLQPCVHGALPAVTLDGALGTLIGLAGLRIRSINEVDQGLPPLMDGAAPEIVLRSGERHT